MGWLFSCGEGPKNPARQVDNGENRMIISLDQTTASELNILYRNSK